MSFTSQLLNSMNALSVSERAAMTKNALKRGQFAEKPFVDHIFQSHLAKDLDDIVLPRPNNASTYDFYGDALGGPISDESGYWTAGENKVPISPSTEFTPFLNPHGEDNSFANAWNSLIDNFKSTDTRASGSTYSQNRSRTNSAKSIEYLEADLAKHYGMDVNAAYGEALQNTAYRRAVADLKAAGLNPVLAVSGMNPAGSYVTGNTLSRASGSGSSGAVTSPSGKYALSSNLYNAVGAAASIIGAVLGFKTGSGPFKWMNAATVSQLSKNLVQSAIQGYGSLIGSK